MIYGTEAPVRHAHRQKNGFVILNRSADNFARVGTDLHYTPGYLDTQISKLVGCLFVLRLNVPVRKTLKHRMDIYNATSKTCPCNIQIIF